MGKEDKKSKLRKARSRDGDHTPEDHVTPRQPPSMNHLSGSNSSCSDSQSHKRQQKKRQSSESESTISSPVRSISPREPHLNSSIMGNQNDNDSADGSDWNEKYTSTNQQEDSKKEQDDAKALVPTSSHPRQISRPGAFDVVGPGARRSDSESSMEEDEEITAAEESREDFRDEESGTVMIKATLVEEEEEAVTRSAPRDAVIRKPPLAHAEPWNNFLSANIKDQQTGDQDDEAHRQKKICGMRRSVCFLLALGITALLVLGPLLYFQLFADDADGSNSDLQDSLWNDEEGDFAPSMAPTIEEPLLRELDKYAHYVVEWGIQGNGCNSLTLPTIHLSCKDSEAIVDVRDHSNENDLICERLGENLVECRSTAVFGAGDQETILGTALVVCGSEDPKGSSKSRALDLQAELQIGSYAQGCSLLIEQNQVTDAQQNVAQEYGGNAATWLNMNRVCPEQSLEREEFNHLFGEALRDHKHQPPKSEKSNNPKLRRLSDHEDEDVGFKTLFELHNRALCEQGESDVVSNSGQSVCVDHSDCVSTRVCQADTLDLCASSCSIASRIVLASDLVVYEDRLDDCQTGRLIPSDWLWHFQQTIGQPTTGSLLP